MTGKASADWPSPRPLGEAPLPSFPVDALPPWLARWVAGQALALQVPPDLPALLALSAVSTALAHAYEVEVRDGWIEPVNIYTLVALPSGTRKSVNAYVQVASNILGQTKLNYNACQLGEVQPITIKYSDQIGEILLSNPKVPRAKWRPCVEILCCNPVAFE